MKTRLLCLTAAAMCSVWSPLANADCGSAGAAGRAGLARPPLTLRSPISNSSAKAAATNALDSFVGIVGLWDVTFFTGPDFFDEGYDQFHSDGTEMMNDVPNPALGNVCLGIWSGKGKTVNLHHVYWNFDNSGNLIGRGIWDSVITVSGDTYSGTWVMKNYDLNGNQAGPVFTGTLQAQRISAP